jgi:hypothetical protein
MPGRKWKSPVAGAAVEDFKKQRAAYEKRRQVIAGSDLPLTPERNPREHPWPESYLEVLAKDVRIPLSFKHLPTTAHQIRILAEAAREARTILYDLERSQQRKRLGISYLMRDAARRIKEVEVEAKAKANGSWPAPPPAVGSRRARPYRPGGY